MEKDVNRMTDYMDKRTAINLLDNLIGMVEDSQENDYDTALKMGIEALNADVQHWIPCSERLPERGEDVLVTRDYDGRKDNNKSCRYVEVASCYGEDDDITWSSFSDEYKMHPKNHYVVAWMPLPEPYRERRTG